MDVLKGLCLRLELIGENLRAKVANMAAQIFKGVNAKCNDTIKPYIEIEEKEQYFAGFKYL